MDTKESDKRMEIDLCFDHQNLRASAAHFKGKAAFYAKMSIKELEDKLCSGAAETLVKFFASNVIDHKKLLDIGFSVAGFSGCVFMIMPVAKREHTRTHRIRFNPLGASELSEGMEMFVMLHVVLRDRSVDVHGSNSEVSRDVERLR